MNNSVYIQGDIFQRQKFGGVSKVFRNILEHNEENEIYISNKYDDNFQIGNKSTLVSDKTLTKVSRSLTRGRFEILFDSYDNFHLSWLTIPLAFTRGKKIVTVHDLIPELGLQNVTHSYLRHRRLQFNWADILLCVSNTTAEDLVRLYPDLKSKISVVYNGGYEEREVTDGPPRLVHIGTRSGYKNFKFLLAALCTCDRQLLSKYEFHILGGGSLSTSEKKQVAQFSEVFSKIVVKPVFYSDQLKQVLTKNTIYVSASRYEGFGIPVLEAFSYGARTLLSDIPVYQEVFSNIAEYFDLGDPRNLSKLLNDHMSNDECASVNYKLKSVRNLTWQNMAKKIHRIYRD